MLAQAAWVGTQFLLAHEMPVHQEYRTRLINAVETDAEWAMSSRTSLRAKQSSANRKPARAGTIRSVPKLATATWTSMKSLARSPGTDVEAMWSIPRATRSRSCPQSLSEPLKVSEPLWPPVTENHFVLEFTLEVLLRPANDPPTTAPSRQGLGHSDPVSRRPRTPPAAGEHSDSFGLGAGTGVGGQDCMWLGLG